MATKQKNDVVYIVGGQPMWHDNELKYSIRSVEKHVKNMRNLIIAGRLPSFINAETVIHIPHNDIHSNKARNIMEKVRVVCGKQSVTKNFMLLNDDYFLLREVDATDYPYYYKCTLDHTMKINAGNEYGCHVRETYEKLKQLELPIRNYDTHKPIIYNRYDMIAVIDKYKPWPNKCGHILRSLYCNTLGIHGDFQLDLKINHPHSKQSWERIISNGHPNCFSIGDLALNSSFKEFIHQLYPNKSKYEL